MSALHSDRAAVQTDQLVDQCEADAGALHRARCLALDPMKAVEDTRQFILRNADAGIADDELGESVSSASCQRDADAAVERVFECVGDKVEDDRVPTCRHRHTRAPATAGSPRRARVRTLAGRAKVAGKLRGVSAEVGRPKRGRTRPASMREKSSSVLTSLSSRRPLRCTIVELVRGCAVTRGEFVLQRT